VFIIAYFVLKICTMKRVCATLTVVAAFSTHYWCTVSDDVSSFQRYTDDTAVFSVFGGTKTSNLDSLPVPLALCYRCLQNSVACMLW